MSRTVERLTSVGQWLIVAIATGSALYALTLAALVPALAGAGGALGPRQLLVLVAAAAGAPTLWILYRLGPGWASPRDLAWRPVAALVARRQLLAILTVSGAACVLAVMLAFASQQLGYNSEAIVVTSSATMLAAAALAWLAQHLDQPAALRALTLVCAATAVVLICAPAGALTLGVLASPALVALALRAAGAPGRSRRRHVWRWRLTNPPPRWSLTRAGAFVEAMVATAITTDAATLELLRSLEATAARRPARPWLPALVVLRALTSARLSATLPSLVLPAGVSAVWGPPAGAAALILLTIVVTARAGTSLATWIEYPSMHRTYASTGPRVPALLVATPLALTAAAAGATALASLPLTWAVAASCFAILTALRRITGRSLIGRSGPLLATAAGPVPLAVVLRLLAGPDVALVALLTIPAGAATSATVGAILLALATTALIISERKRRIT